MFLGFSIVSGTGLRKLKNIPIKKYFGPEVFLIGKNDVSILSKSIPKMSQKCSQNFQKKIRCIYKMLQKCPKMFPE